MPVAPFISREARPPSPLETYDAVLSLGGPGDPTTDEDMPWGPTERRAIEKLLERGTPFMGICLGAQLLAQVTGGRASGDRDGTDTTPRRRPPRRRRWGHGQERRSRRPRRLTGAGGRLQP